MECVFCSSNGRYDDFRQCGGLEELIASAGGENEIAISAQEHAQGDVIALDDLGISVQYRVLCLFQNFQLALDHIQFILLCL